MDGSLKDELWSYVQAHVFTGSAATHIQNTLSCSFIVENGICVWYVFSLFKWIRVIKVYKFVSLQEYSSIQM